MYICRRNASHDIVKLNIAIWRIPSSLEIYRKISNAHADCNKWRNLIQMCTSILSSSLSVKFCNICRQLSFVCGNCSLSRYNIQRPFDDNYEWNNEIKCSPTVNYEKFVSISQRLDPFAFTRRMHIFAPLLRTRHSHSPIRARFSDSAIKILIIKINISPW